MSDDRSVRLHKFMANCGVASRRECEQIIESGRVFVNGNIVNKLGTTIATDDVVTVDGKVITMCEEKVYIMFNKPARVVTTSKDQFGRKSVTDYFKHLNIRIFPVGRLDYDTEGLLLLTNDGDFMFKVTHPSSNLEKVYIAEVQGCPSDSTIERMREPIVIDGRVTVGAEVERIMPPEMQKISRSTLEITIHEGRNRQVRRICESAGHPVIHLKRISIGSLMLGELAPSEWRYLTESEVRKIENFS